MTRIVIVAGGSTAGKTSLACSLATMGHAAAIICGDQWQLVAGFPIATSIVDADWAGRRELYGMLPPNSGGTLSATEYHRALESVLRRYPGQLVVIDGLSFAYFELIPLLRRQHKVLVIGLRPRWITLPFRLLVRMWRAWRQGVVHEIKSGTAQFGPSAFHPSRTFVVRDVAKYGAVIGGALVFVKLLTGEAIRGKDHNIRASGMVDQWL